MPDRKAIAPLVVFFVSLLALSATFETFAVTTGFASWAVWALMWSVGVSAIAALLLTRGKLSDLGWRPGAFKYHLIALALPLAYAFLAYVPADMLGLAQFPVAGRFDEMLSLQNVEGVSRPTAIMIMVVIVCAIGGFQTLVTGVGEEIGWRGFLAPRFDAMFGFVRGALLTGLIWASWHTPVILFGKYNGGGAPAFEVAAFMIMAVAMCGPMAWLRLRSGSFWPCAVLHGSHNFIIQFWFDGQTARGPSEITMVGEFGVLMAVTTVVVSLPFWIMGARGLRDGTLSVRDRIPAKGTRSSAG